MGKSKALIKNFRLLFILIAGAMLVATSYFVIKYHRKQSALIPHYEALMQEKAFEYAKKITNYFDDLEKKATQISRLPDIENALEQVKTVQPKDPQANNPLHKLEISIKEFIATEPALFKNILLATAEGKMIFSLNQPKYLGFTFSQKSTENNELAFSAQRSYMCLVPDISNFAFDEIIKEPAIYITIPIFKNGKMLGFLFAQANQNNIYKITQNYLGLGKTGEFVLGNRIKDDTQIIAPSRLSPNLAFKKRGIYKPDDQTPMQSAVFASSGTGLGKDYRNTQVIASWRYIPNADWGLVAKIDYREVIDINKELKNMMLIMLIITFALWCALAISFANIRRSIATKIKKIPALIPPQKLVSRISLLLFGASLLVSSYIYFQMIAAERNALQNAQKSAQKSAADTTKEIQNNLEKFSLLVQGVASSLSSGSLSKENITINITRKLNEESQLTSFCVAYKQPTINSQKAFAPYMTRKNGAISTEELEDILKAQNRNSNFIELPWFNAAIKNNAGTWIQPTHELLSNQLVITYAEPFFEVHDTKHENPIGVVAATYALDAIKPLLSNLSIGETGYPFVVNKEGKFIFHPTEKYESDTTIFSVAKLEGNEALNSIDTHIVEGKTGLNSYESEKTNQITWVAYQPIPIIQWSLAILFTENEISPPGEPLHHQMIWLLIFSVLTLLFLCSTVTSLTKHKPMRAFSFASSLVFALGILGIWRLVEPKTEINNGILVTNSIGLDAYVDELKKDARQRHEPELIPLPTGIFIESWGIVDATHVEIAGTLWQQFNDTLHKGLAHEFDLPDAISTKKSDQYETIEKDHTTVGWNLSATIAQQFDFSKYPLDSQRIQIVFDHKDIEKNVLLIPDLANYESIRPADLPGLDRSFQYYGFNIRRSFFSLEKSKEDTNFGVQSYSAISEHIKLNYNVIITRDLLNALIVYFLPLLVILFSLFAIFSITGRIGKGRSKKKIFVSLTGYTGLLFALIALHHTLRGQYPSGNVLYIEYFFFYSYMTILVLIVHGAIIQAEVYQDFVNEKVTPLMRNLFWPIQLSIWFITTVIVFYN
jgi:hypothetical protein